ncbi:RNA polymerase sigma factor SigE [uncultured Jatrophihabitans sp.]|uniref:RNA polymerase sigma factor SigE n=1 Tax=uncultured Jatrophihabitans sp. TaxID=1610747 RepID=UPI0035CC8FDB
MTDAARSAAESEISATGSPAADEASAWVPPSWDEVVREHADRVYRLAFRLSGNRADAEDLTQETFVRVFRSLAQYSPGTFEGWLHRITTNLFLDMVRRRQRIRFDALPEDAGDRLAGADPGPEQSYDEMHLDPEVQAALDALPPDFRVAVVLCDLEQLSYEEIAATLNIKVGTVRSRIHRGRVLLRDALAHRAPGTRPAEPGREAAAVPSIPPSTELSTQPSTQPQPVRTRMSLFGEPGVVGA